MVSTTVAPTGRDSELPASGTRVVVGHRVGPGPDDARNMSHAQHPAHGVHRQSAYFGHWTALSGSMKPARKHPRQALALMLRGGGPRPARMLVARCGGCLRLDPPRFSAKECFAKLLPLVQTSLAGPLSGGRSERSTTCAGHGSD